MSAYLRPKRSKFVKWRKGIHEFTGMRRKMLGYALTWVSMRLCPAEAHVHPYVRHPRELRDSNLTLPLQRLHRGHEVTTPNFK